MINYYMHRYQQDTMPTIRFEQLQEIHAKYNYEIAAVDLRIVNLNLIATEKRDLEKRKTAYQKRLEERLEFDKNLAEFANAQVSIDLDDGVKVNYEKFDKVLTLPVPFTPIHKTAIVKLARLPIRSG